MLEYHEKDEGRLRKPKLKPIKNGKVVKNRWRENMVGFSEIVISFGTQRPKGPKEGLNQAEVNIVNAQNFA